VAAIGYFHSTSFKRFRLAECWDCHNSRRLGFGNSKLSDRVCPNSRRGGFHQPSMLETNNIINPPLPNDWE
jgi:hypothetical protein